MKPSAALQLAKVLTRKPSLQRFPQSLTIALPDPTAVLLMLGPLLPNLRHLRICSYDLEQPMIPNPEFFAALSLTRSIRSFDLWHRVGERVDLSVVLRILWRLPDVTHVDSNGVGGGKLSSSDSLLKNQPRAQIGTLLLPYEDGEDTSASLCRCLCASGSVSSLRRLYVWYDTLKTPAGRNAVKDILETAGPSLTDFALDLLTYEHDNEQINVLSDLFTFTSNVRLRRIYLFRVHASQELSEALVTLISSVASPLEEIHITLWPGWNPSNYSLWQRLDDILSQSTFDSLSAVKFRLEYLNPMDELLLESSLCETLSTIHARGILGFDGLMERDV
ncbi:hypothetical protein K474DRAFT_1710621 [Panus rudis PR-1116 ss-1]|nr:hypothetical protein K474DRAFT_1710621 [Panus rudis PR-1116 ss-1]